MRDIFANNDLHEQFYQLLECPDERDRLYVYRLRNGAAIKPAIINGMPFSELLDVLRDEHGGGAFRIMIRRGEKLLLAGRIGVGPPLRSQARW
jgi:hypothetical protein